MSVINQKDTFIRALPLLSFKESHNHNSEHFKNSNFKANFFTGLMSGVTSNPEQNKINNCKKLQRIWIRSHGSTLNIFLYLRVVFNYSCKLSCLQLWCKFPQSLKHCFVKMAIDAVPCLKYSTPHFSITSALFAVNS